MAVIHRRNPRLRSPDRTCRCLRSLEEMGSRKIARICHPDDSDGAAVLHLYQWLIGDPVHEVEDPVHEVEEVDRDASDNLQGFPCHWKQVLNRMGMGRRRQCA
jgi:hypothetical protein